ncbi:MAG: translocation/assembly module TamB domain-containing protein [Ignavibacteria bacterium]
MNKKMSVKPKRSTFHKVVNVFIIAFIGLTGLIIIFLIFTQTVIFHELLRKEIVKQVNAGINGRLNIGEIEGTIFTSLTIKNAVLTMESDTVISVGRIQLKTSPLQLLLKRIYVRNFELSDAKVSLLMDSGGVLNISRLGRKKSEEDTTSSSFPLTIIIADFKLKNISFRMADYNKRDVDSSYPALNMNNLRVDSLYLALDAFASINDNDYQVRISGLSAKVNLQNFRLKDLMGNFSVTEHNFKVESLVIKSGTTDVDLSAQMDQVNIFKELNIAKLKDCPVKVDLNAGQFDFADLAHFTESTGFLKGTLKTKILVTGTFGDMNIEKLSLDYLRTQLNLTGNIKNLHSPEDLFIKAKVLNSGINEPDIAELMPVFQIPAYKKLQFKNIEIDYEGRPLEFKTVFKTDLPEGYIQAKADFDFTGDEMKYNVEMQTSKLNVEPVVNLKTLLNSNVIVHGRGTKPDKLSANINIALGSSRIKQYQIDSLRLNIGADNGRMLMRLKSFAMNALLSADGNLDISDLGNPVYAVTGDVQNLNIKRLITDTLMTPSSLNFGFNFTGRSFDFHKMESQLDFVLNESNFMNKKIEPTNFRLVYTKPASDERLIALNSDFADMNVRGNFSIDDAASIIGYEYNSFFQSIMKKVSQFNPVFLVNDSLKIKEFESWAKLAITPVPVALSDSMNIVYDLNIKDFKLLSQFTGINRIDMDGLIGGTVMNDKAGFKATNNINLKYLKLLTDDNLSYISNLGFNLDISRSNDKILFDNVVANMQFTAERVISGTDLKNISILMNLKKNILSYNLQADMDTTMEAQITGNVDMTTDKFMFAVDKFFIDYNNIKWINGSILAGVYSKDAFEVKKFTLAGNGTEINLLGGMLSNGMLKDARLEIKNLDVAALRGLSGLASNFEGKINLTAKANGYLDKPTINLRFDADSVKAYKNPFGSMWCDLAYAEKLLKTNLQFLDTSYNSLQPLFTLTGSFPVDLGFMGVKDRVLKGAPINARMKSNDFDISVVSAFVPEVSQLKGKLNADISISGMTDKLNYGGNLKLNNGSFIAKQNNLPYEMDLDVSLADETIKIENIALRNAGGTMYNGTLSGGGKINFGGMNLKDINVTISGSLALLSSSVKGGSLPVNGNLIIQSDGNWNFTYNDGSSNLDGTVLLKKTNVTIVPVQSSYGARKDDIIYHYVIDSSGIDKKQAEINQVIDSKKKYAESKKIVTAKASKFDFNTRVKIKNSDQATVTYVISPELKSQLTAKLDGELIYGSNGMAQGKFNLLKGSNLFLFKTLTATGTIYFESNIIDPRLDIEATYTANHDGATASDSGKVAVKIFLKGTLQEIEKNLAANEENIAIYIGDQNIQNGVSSPEYSIADAMSFIISGKFQSELTATEKKKVAIDVAGYGTSIASSLISGFVNSQLGDAVEDVELEKTGEQYNFGVSGKVKNIRYSIGGSTEALQDFTKANLRIEIPFNDRFSVRVERKDPVTETSTLNEKITELSLRYKFIF